MILPQITLSDLQTGKPFDVTIIGGGIIGAAVFYRLSLCGFRVLLIDKGDFASATSQASSMMIWGSLPDLCNFRFSSVGKLCATRDKLLRERDELIKPHQFVFLPTKTAHRKRISAAAALYTYWFLGLGRRSRPRFRRDPSGLGYLNTEQFGYSYEYEEAIVSPSDARFVLDWIFRPQSVKSTALNYCKLESGTFDVSEKVWNLDISDLKRSFEGTVKTKFVINCAGAWTDTVNSEFLIDTPYKHAFGKGVFLSVPRIEGHESTLMIETPNKDGCMALIPWGPVSMFGPTETRVRTPEEGFKVLSEDIRHLFTGLNSHLNRPIHPEDIVSLRCGVRSLAVPSGFSDEIPTNGLKRDFAVTFNAEKSWITVHGGKMTSCVRVAEEISKIIDRTLPVDKGVVERPSFRSKPELEAFPGFSEPVPTPKWSFENEKCTGLEDYLRRRTNISQWIPRCGFGRNDEFKERILEIATAFTDRDSNRAQNEVNLYLSTVENAFDRPLAAAF